MRAALIILVIVILAIIGIWWYRSSTPSNINVNTGGANVYDNTSSSSYDNNAPTGSSNVNGTVNIPTTTVRVMATPRVTATPRTSSGY